MSTNTSSENSVQPVESPPSPDEASFTPPQLSKVVISLTTSIFFAVVYSVTGLTTPGGVAIIAGLLLSVAVTLLNKTPAVYRGVGNLLLFAAGGLAVFAMSLVSAPLTLAGATVYTIITIGMFAAFGIAGMWAPSIGYWRLNWSIGRAMYSIIPPIIAASLLSIPYVLQALQFNSERSLELFTSTFISSSGSPQLGVFLFLCGVLSLALMLAVWNVPFTVFVPTEYASKTKEHLDRFDSTLRKVTLVLLPVGVILFVAQFGGGLGDLYEGLPPIVLSILSVITTSIILRIVVLSMIAVCSVLIVISGIISTLAKINYTEMGQTAAQMTSGFLLTIGMYFFGGSLIATIPLAETPVAEPASTLLEAVGGTILGLLLAAGGLLGFLLLLIVIPVTSGLGFIPDKTASQSITALSVASAAIAVQLSHPTPVLLFSGVLCALVIWDIGEYSAVLTEELGPTADSGHIQLVHIFSTFLIAGLTLLLSLAIYQFDYSVDLGLETVIPAAFAGVFGVLILLIVSGRAK